MDLLWSLGLLVIIALALNQMAGGRASNVLRPVGNLANGLVTFAVRMCLSGLGTIVRLLGGSVKPGKLPGSPKIGADKTPPGPTPPRWGDD